jgi:DNA-binding NtrC family response regulator
VEARILVVDDERNILALFKRMLSAETFQGLENPSSLSYTHIDVDTAISGESAWEKIKSGPFDLIISDLAMEGMSGIDLLERVKSIKPDIPFMILTGVGTIEDAVRSMKLGAYDYLTKPFQHDELLLSINKALDYGRLHSEVKTLRKKLDHQAESEPVGREIADKKQKSVAGNGKTVSGNAGRNGKFVLTDEQTDWINHVVRKNLPLKSISDTVSGEVEKIVIEKILAEVGDNKAEVARRLGISRPALYKKINDYRIK